MLGFASSSPAYKEQILIFIRMTGLFCLSLFLKNFILRNIYKKQILNPVQAGNSPRIATAFPTSMWVR